ncbi:venom carboxylesterase-6-like [Zophobas morio]|uniref:venom carboxylesterase-6-like n=1 Tax=Zophobas morio TaxID=2755281 RepID=UPI003083CF4B
MLAILSVLTIFTLGVSGNEKFPLVKTPLGEIRGYHKTSFEGRTFSAFEGIPFAKPPIGERRFEEPEPVDPWSGVWNATSLFQCVQTNSIQLFQTPGDEDCLYINVFVPREKPNPDENLDVVVHIHGGAFMYGSGHVYSPPTLIMDREVIYVTFNYRLGILGFLSTEDDVVPGNNGLKDQTLALKWIRDNIASFGGNPNSVTITGLSAGGSSVHLHYFSKLSKGLFQRGFAQSGLALNPFSIQEQPLMRAKKLADAVGCPTSTTRVMVDCLKQRPYQHLFDKLPLFFNYIFLPCAPFGPVVEKGGSNPFLDEDPYYLLKKGDVHDVPWLASMAIHEGLFPVAYFMEDLDNIDVHWEEWAPAFLEFNYTLSSSLWESTARKIKEHYLGDEHIKKENVLKLIQIFSDRYFLNDAETAVRMQAKVNKSPVYYYLFGYPGDNNEQKMVGHGADSKYFFGPTIVPSPLTPDEIKMKDLLLDMLVAFAKTGKPTLGGVDLKPTGYNGLTYLEVNGFEPDEIQLKTTDELMTSRSFWKSLNFMEGENLISAKDEL